MYTSVHVCCMSLYWCFQITFIPVVPPVLVQLLKTSSVTSDQLASVKNVFYGAAPTGAELEKEWDAKFPHIKRHHGTELPRIPKRLRTAYDENASTYMYIVQTF